MTPWWLWLPAGPHPHPGKQTLGCRCPNVATSAGSATKAAKPCASGHHWPTWAQSRAVLFPVDNRSSSTLRSILTRKLDFPMSLNRSSIVKGSWLAGVSLYRVKFLFWVGISFLISLAFSLDVADPPSVTRPIPEASGSLQR